MNIELLHDVEQLIPEPLLVHCGRDGDIEFPAALLSHLRKKGYQLVRLAKHHPDAGNGEWLLRHDGCDILSFGLPAYAIPLVLVYYQREQVAAQLPVGHASHDGSWASFWDDVATLTAFYKPQPVEPFEEES